jgi:predicted nuclease of predicted toxin-antitoxin system
MRFLANENFPGDAVTQLKAAGHDIVWVRIAAPGIKDEDVLAWAAREARIVLTFDKDFRELAWRVGLPASSGVVLLRLPMPPVAEVGTALAARIVERTDWAGHFTVIEPARIRMRPLPVK